MPCGPIVSKNFNASAQECGAEPTRTSRKTMHSTAAAHIDSPVAAKMSTLDRLLPLWIIGAMALGLLLGRVVPGLAEALDSVKVAAVSLPIAIGLLDRKSTRLNSSHVANSYAVFCSKKEHESTPRIR